MAAVVAVAVAVAVAMPVAVAVAEDPGVDLVLGDRLLLRRPEPEVCGGGGGERLRDWVVRERLDRVVVRVLQDALGLGRPDDDGLVGAARGEALAVPEKAREREMRDLAKG
eukprot:5577418-Pleurochrysis_carterae.AAC.1